LHWQGNRNRMDNVPRRIEARAAEHPERLLYSFLDAHGAAIEQLTRAAFLDRVRLIASHLRLEEGLREGDRALLAYPPGLEMICAFFGCVWAGVIPVPVAPPASHSMDAALYKMRFIAADCSAAAILIDRRTHDMMLGYLGDPDHAGVEATWLAAQRLAATDEYTQYATDTAVRGHSDILFLQYTSGTTSAPKGVKVTHDNIIANAGQVVDHPDAVGVSWLPQHHDMGLIGYYINDALVGGTLYGFSPTTFIQRPALWLDSISRYRATATSAPNFAFEYCLRPGRIPQATLETLDLSSLRFLMAAAEPIKPAVYQNFLQAFMPYGLQPKAFVVAYGLAENTLAVSSYGRTVLSVHRQTLAEQRVRLTTSVAEVSAATHLMSCGRPLGDTRVLIVDPERRCALPPDTVGEIWTNGRSKCAGYWGNLEASTATFEARLADDSAGTGATFLRTGDMGFLHDGELYVCGRRKDMIIVRGQNYYPQDIELLIERWSDAIRAGGVAAFEFDDAGRQSIVAVAELASTRRVPDGMAILSAVRRYLGVELHRIVFVPPRSVPKTTSGKVMRLAARDMLAAGTLQEVGQFALPASEDAPDAADADRPFAAFRTRCGLRGDEDITLAEAGMDSFDLVLFLHELTELLATKGGAELGEAIDYRLVQALRVNELFALIDRLESEPDTAIDQFRAMLNARRATARAADHSLMAADRVLAFTPPPATQPASSARARAILLSGGSGFLGPFLLANLLRQTVADVHVLVRATDADQGKERLRQGLRGVCRDDAALRAFEARVTAVPGDLERPGFGLSDRVWSDLAARVDTILHNGALVNYLFNYRRMRAANVQGTNELLRLAFDSRRKAFNYVSTTFIFGWATKDVLFESDSNDAMELLDFGYSQSKGVSEQLVLDARRNGLTTRIFRPALITPSLAGEGGGFDITLRLLAFMIRHGISVNALNQVSFVPADVTANNIVALCNEPATADQVFHMTRDVYANMLDVIAIITRLTGRRFEMVDLPSFVPEVIRRCTLDDPLFPLLDFLVNSVDNISSMEFKRYDNAGYRQAREASKNALPDPSLEDTVAGILRFMLANRLSDVSFIPEPAPVELQSAQ
jgi:thioester reductase-like protein